MISVAEAALLGVLTGAVLWALAVIALVVAGRRGDARALLGLIPDCVVLLRRLMRDPRVPRRTKLLLGLVVAYLALPFDVVPDFIPVAGQLDDAIVVALAFRALLGAAGDDLLLEHWPGPRRSLELLRRLALLGRPA
jgi:uncharacterized membrane protein YkvA (DUF1232 family)